ncbi:MAG TPA: haloalkane dehalogenase [Acidimicrobiia bacterium]|nr:haloalkane dehalogenase [Acidimicrobiia bacterium]
MKFVRTPDERFGELPDYDFEPNWFDWEGLRLHFLDEGQGPPVVLFHGEPTWAFLYRKVIPVLTAAGYRAIAPDYPGFGRSDKPTDPGFYTYDRMTRAIAALAEHLDLSDAAVVVQDWGGPLGLRIATEAPDRFERLVILNTGLYTGRQPGQAFLAWQGFVTANPNLPVARILSMAAITTWPEEVVAAYEAPFPTPEHKVGAWRMPLIVPLADDDPGAAEMMVVREALALWEKPALVLFGDSDPIFSVRAGARMAALIPGAGDLEVVEGAGHFLQEDKGEEVAERIVEFLRRTDPAP